MHCREECYDQAVLAGVSESIPCCVRMARELWQEFSVVDSFATGSKQSLDAMDFGLASSVRQQNLASFVSACQECNIMHKCTKIHSRFE